MGKQAGGEGLTWVFQQKVEQLELMVKDKTHNLRRLEAQRNELNTQGGARGQRVGSVCPCMLPPVGLSGA
jgi:hypothetical protein